MSRRLSYDDAETHCAKEGTSTSQHPLISNGQPQLSGNLGPAVDQGGAFAYLAMADTANLHPKNNRVPLGTGETPDLSISTPPNVSYWDNLGKLPLYELADQATKMHPQFAALLLSRLPRHMTSDVFGLLPEDIASDVFSRLISLREPAPTAVGLIENDFFRAITTPRGFGVKSGPPHDNAFISVIYDMPPSSQSEFVDQAFNTQGNRFLQILETQNQIRLMGYPNRDMFRLYLNSEVVTLLAAFSDRTLESLQLFLDSLADDTRAQFSQTLDAQPDVHHIDRVKAQCILISTLINLPPESAATDVIDSAANLDDEDIEPLAAMLV